MTDRWTFITPYIVIYVIKRKTNELHFVSPSCSDQSKTDGHIFFIPHIESTSDIRTNYIWFHSSYWNLRKTDGETTFHSLLIILLESKADRWTNYVSFHPSYWDPSKTDRRTHLHFTPQNWIHVRQTEFHFAPHIGILVRQTYGQTTFCLTPYFGIQLRQAHG